MGFNQLTDGIAVGSAVRHLFPSPERAFHVALQCHQLFQLLRVLHDVALYDLAYQRTWCLPGPAFVEDRADFLQGETEFLCLSDEGKMRHVRVREPAISVAGLTRWREQPDTRVIADRVGTDSSLRRNLGYFHRYFLKYR